MLTGGLPAAGLLAVALVCWARGAWNSMRNIKNSNSQYAQRRLGAVIVFILGSASALDYPLRVPSLACLFVVAAAWMVVPVTAPAPQRRSEP